MTYLFIGLLLGLVVGFLLTKTLTASQMVQERETVARLKATLEAEQAHYAQSRIDEERQKELEMAVRMEEIETLRRELRAMAAELAQRQGAELRAQHAEGLTAMLNPLKESISQFKEQFVRTSSATETHIKMLSEQSHALGREAEALAKALRGNTKLQGNWGEQILERLLEASGLTRGRDYDVQQHEVTDDGERIIPDVVVHLPEGRDIVIDSKVSLTAFSGLALTDDPAEMARLRKEHLRSVYAHVKELSEKRYNRHLTKAVGHVLMFIPHEAAYLTALEEDPELLTKAYRQEIIIINPSNLFMALQLAYNLWQAERQSQSVADIYASAERLHRKFASFADNFVRIGNGINRLQMAYDDAQKQLTSGKGNILSQLKNWETKGFKPTRELPLQEKEAEMGEDEEM